MAFRHCWNWSVACAAPASEGSAAVCPRGDWLPRTDRTAVTSSAAAYLMLFSSARLDICGASTRRDYSRSERRRLFIGQLNPFRRRVFWLRLVQRSIFETIIHQTRNSTYSLRPLRALTIY